jgi:hypothetical protein
MAFELDVKMWVFMESLTAALIFQTVALKLGYTIDIKRGMLLKDSEHRSSVSYTI